MIKQTDLTHISPQHELVVDMNQHNEVQVTVGSLHCVMQTDAVWVRNGEKEITHYVDTVIKPAVNQLIVTGKEDIEQIATDTQKTFNKIVVDNENVYKAFIAEQKEIFNTNVREKTSQFNQNVSEQQNVFDNHVSNVEQSINQKTASIETLAQQVAQNKSETEQYAAQASQSAQTASTAQQSVHAIQTTVVNAKNETISACEQVMSQSDIISEQVSNVQTAVQTVTQKVNEAQISVQSASTSAKNAQNAQTSAENSLNQIQTLMSDIVTISSDQTITGNKTFVTPIVHQTKAFDATQTAMSSDVLEPVMQVIDKSGQSFMKWQHGKEADGTLFGRLSLSRNINGGVHEQSLNMGIDNDGFGFIQCLTPQSESNSSDIATTQWSRSTIRDITIPDWKTCVEISGTGQKYAPFDGVLIVTPEDQGESCFTMIIGVHEYNLAQEYFGADYGHTGYGFFPMRENLPYMITHMVGCYCRFFRYIGG